MAAYQVADLIGEALDSIRRQTVAPLEVIVCDDGSTDDLEAALSPYSDEIVLIRKEHGGEASAKNAAATAARGDFVVILDADDVYLPRRLEALTALARARPDLDILTTDAYLVVHGRRVRRNYGPRWRFDVVDQRRAILQRNFIFGHAAVRRERLHRARRVRRVDPLDDRLGSLAPPHPRRIPGRRGRRATRSLPSASDEPDRPSPRAHTRQDRHAREG